MMTAAILTWPEGYGAQTIVAHKRLPCARTSSRMRTVFDVLLPTSAKEDSPGTLTHDSGP